MESIGIIGASSNVGLSVADALLALGYRPIGFSRSERESRTFEWRRLGLAQGRAPIARWINLAHIWKNAELHEMLESYGAKRIVSMSSTSMFTKKGSPNEADAEKSRLLREGERTLAEWADAKGIAWVVLRPTMIYGLNRDRNVREIALMIKRLGFFPVLGEGRGLRQPIHVEDLAEACVKALLSTATRMAYNVSGAEVLTYREMVARVATAMGRRPLVPSVPRSAFVAACSVLNRIPRFAHWSPAMAERTNLDMDFDHRDAVRDFGFTPRPFVLEDTDLPSGKRSSSMSSIARRSTSTIRS